jgi:hypothetical protein
MDTFVSMRELDKFNADGTPNVSPSKIPSNWCLQVTDENVEEVSKWRTAGGLGKGTEGWISHDGYEDVRGYWTPDKPRGLKEITTEQFFKHVLNKPCYGELEHPSYSLPLERTVVSNPSIYSHSVDAGVYLTEHTIFVEECSDETPSNKYQVMEQQDAIILSKSPKRKKVFVI